MTEKTLRGGVSFTPPYGLKLQIKTEGFYSKYGDEKRFALLRENTDYIVHSIRGNKTIVYGTDIGNIACLAIVHPEEVKA
jgi:hypothetical protein